MNGRAPGPEVEAAYAHCAQVTRAAGSSFAAAFWMLPRPRRQALHAIYAFCRLADDIADDPDVAGDRLRLLERWSDELSDAYRGKATHPVGVALGHAVERFALPEEIFQELLRGIETDLRGEPIDSFADLERYCYRVASTVGLLLVRVLEAGDPGALEYARSMGIAVQLTNILRDVGEDAVAGRIYLAREDLERLGVRPESLCEARMTEELRLLLALYAERARLYYERAAVALPEQDRRRLRPAEAMGHIYRALLDELHGRGFPCLEASLRLSRPRRLAIAASTWLGLEALHPRGTPRVLAAPADRWAASGQR